MRALHLGATVKRRMVSARSPAEIPVVVPSTASMLTVKRVPRREVFLCTMG